MDTTIDSINSVQTLKIGSLDRKFMLSDCRQQNIKLIVAFSNRINGCVSKL